ncbi:hypothetical protein NHH03_06105 [Stieleria sp. TO1_6]|nr:hypothetical protein [Stieleria tagensis]
MTARQEHQIMQVLQRECQPDWNPGTTIKELAESLSQHLPVSIDQRSLEEIGLDIDVEIDSVRLFDVGALDPHAATSEKQKWWQQTGTIHANQKPRGVMLVTAVMERLHSVDLTLQICDGRLTILTLEYAESRPVTRVYDVTPISTDDQSLAELIIRMIDPAGWEKLGGESTIQPIAVRGRRWLLVSTMTTTHWKVQRLLDRINR